MHIAILLALIATLAAAGLALRRLSGRTLWRGLSFCALGLAALSSATLLVWEFSKARTISSPCASCLRTLGASPQI
jgi:hypothetical protein